MPYPSQHQRTWEIHPRVCLPAIGGERVSSCPITNAPFSFLRITIFGHRSMSVRRPNAKFWKSSKKSGVSALPQHRSWTTFSGIISLFFVTTSTGCTKPAIMTHSSNLNIFIMPLSQFIPETYPFGMLFLLLGIFLSWLCLRIYKCHRLKTIHPDNSNSTGFVPEKRYQSTITHITHTSIDHKSILQ